MLEASLTRPDLPGVSSKHELSTPNLSTDVPLPADEDDSAVIYLSVSVSDTGRGLTKQEITNLFQRFKQAYVSLSTAKAAAEPKADLYYAEMSERISATADQDLVSLYAEEWLPFLAGKLESSQNEGKAPPSPSSCPQSVAAPL